VTGSARIPRIIASLIVMGEIFTKINKYIPLTLHLEYFIIKNSANSKNSRSKGICFISISLIVFLLRLSPSPWL